MTRPIYEPWNVPREDGGWKCGKHNCGHILEQKDFLGQYSGNLFIIKGYVCPACGYRHGSGKQYNWRLLPIPTIAASHMGATN